MGAPVGGGPGSACGPECDARGLGTSGARRNASAGCSCPAPWSSGRGVAASHRDGARLRGGPASWPLPRTSLGPGGGRGGLGSESSGPELLLGGGWCRFGGPSSAVTVSILSGT